MSSSLEKLLEKYPEQKWDWDELSQPLDYSSKTG